MTSEERREQEVGVEEEVIVREVTVKREEVMEEEGTEETETIEEVMVEKIENQKETTKDMGEEIGKKEVMAEVEAATETEIGTIGRDMAEEEVEGEETETEATAAE